MKTIFIFLIIIWLALVLINLQKLNWFLALFIVFAAAERFWETFIGARHNILDKDAKFDRLFKIISLSYVILMFSTVLEFAYISKVQDYGFMVIGLFVFLLALALRLSAVRALGGRLDTSIFTKEGSFGEKKFIRHGPYKYLRHPIYLGTILECLSLPLIYSARYTFLFALLFCLPLLVVRAYLEEGESLEVFGQEYLKYKSEVFAFLPFKKC